MDERNLSPHRTCHFVQLSPRLRDQEKVRLQQVPMKAD